MSTDKRNGADVQNFVRTLTAEEKKAYTDIKGYNATTRKRLFREALAAKKLKNLAAKEENIVECKESDTTVGTYENFWMIAQKEGGLMDREFGIRIATNICEHATKKGPPAVMWDPTGQCLKYLHCQLGKSDIQTRARKSVLSADVEMDAETIRLAMQQAEEEGLSTEIPAEHLQKELGAEPENPKTATEPEVTGQEPIASAGDATKDASASAGSTAASTDKDNFKNLAL